MRYRVSFVVLATALAAAGAYWHWVPSSGAVPAAAAIAPSPAAPPVTVARALSRPVARSAAFTGHLEAARRVAVRPRVDGYIQAVGFVEGGLVEEGQLLFQIDPRPYQAAVDRADAQFRQALERLALAELELGRAKALVARGAASRERLDTAAAARRELQARADEARAALEAARLDLAYTRITAPIAGRIGRAALTEGNLVSAAEPVALATIVAVDPMHATFDIDEATYLTLAATGQVGSGAARVRIGLAGEAGRPREGTLDFVDNQADAGTGTVRARAVLPNPDGLLSPGLFARVQVEVEPPRETVLIADAAVGTDQGRRFVLVLGADNTLEYRPVTTGPLVDGLRAVDQGLASGEAVVLKGLARPGMAVEPTFVPMPSADQSPVSTVPITQIPEEEALP